MCDREMSSLAVCPYCDELVGADAVQFGAERFHPECYAALGQELDGSEVSSKEIASTCEVGADHSADWLWKAGVD